MTSDSLCWSPAPSSQGDYGQFPGYQGGRGDFARTLSLNRSNSSALDMRQLTRALSEAREGSGQVRDALLSASFRPRLPGLTKIVSKLSKEGSWRKALEVYEVVEELGLRPDTALTNSAISACDKGGRWQKALEIFDRMEPLGLHRDAITYSATISALAKGKQWHAALQIFDHMQLHGVEADVVTCCSLINALERGGQWQLAEKLFLEMCTVQEEQEQLAALVRAAPNVPLGLGGLHHTISNSKNPHEAAIASVGAGVGLSSLARSHTSPSSVLLALRSGSAGPGNHGGLLPVNEIDGIATGADASNPSELDLTLSLSAQQGILDALVEGAGAADETQKDDQASKKAAASAFAPAPAPATAAVGIQSAVDNGNDLATAFARVTSISTVSPSGSVDPGFDRALSATLGGGGGSSGGAQQSAAGMHRYSSNPFDVVSGREHAHTPPPPPGLMRTGSAASALASAYSYGASIADSDINGSYGGMSAAAAPFVSLGNGGVLHGGGQRHPSLPPAPPSRLQRGTFGREPPVNGPVQAAAAAHLRRAMSCFPDFDSNDTDATADGGSTSSHASLTAMFNFSHATRVAPNRVCCNALLAAYARAKPPQWQRALHLLQAMWSGGPTLIPDVVSYNTALKACANAFQLSKGIEIYHEMRRNGVYPNATSYNCLIAAASDASNKEVMQELGGWLNTSATEVQATCMNAYVTGLVKVGLWNEALTQFQNMLTPNAPAHPTSATFCTIMAGHMNTGDYSAVQRTFEYMRASGVSPNIVAFNTLLAALAAMGNWTVALDVLNAALAAAVEGVHANTATFNTVLAALAKGAIAPNAVQQYPFLASQAVQVYQQMQTVRGGATPDATTFNTLITILDATKHNTQVVAVYNLMTGAGLTPDGTVGHKVLSAAITTGQIAKAVHVAQSLQLQNVSIEPRQLSTLLASCVNAGAWDLATRLCSAAHSAQGAAVAAAMFNFVLRSALEGGQLSLAMEIINVMQSMGIEVEKSTASVIIQGGGNAGLAAVGDGVGNLNREGSITSNTGSYPHQHATVVFQADNTNSDKTNNNNQQQHNSPANATAILAVPRSSSTGNAVGLSMQFPITPQIASSPGANLSPESPRNHLSKHLLGRLTTSTPPALSNAGLRGGVVDEHHLRRTSSETEGYIIGNEDHYGGNTTTTNATSSATAAASSGAVLDTDQLTLADTNGMLASLESTGDAAGCIEVLANMKLVGIMPDSESYYHVITTLVNAGDGASAVEICRQGHEAGGLKHLQMRSGTGNIGDFPVDEASREIVVDLRGCAGEVAVTVAVLWLLQINRKNSTNNNHVRFIFGPLGKEEEEAEKDQGSRGTPPSVDSHAVRAEVQRILTSGHSSLYPALSGLAPSTISSTSIKFSVEGPCAILEVQPPMTTTWSAAAAAAAASGDGRSTMD
ncbi:hypothetical protein Ndes2526B_g06369 [Nannochloris sp. 'desiccata']|nr:hypothetical protein KSW81_008134 [Chlorella desiccata (nom. nud.)]KAH7619396.1 putative Pentatricopeptide repeat-containing protein [Chlorella desiccata (nom. nud.)]